MINDLYSKLISTSLPIAVGGYDIPEGGSYPDAYIVITPGSELVESTADNKPLIETTDADVELYMRGDYQATKDTIKGLLCDYYIAISGYAQYIKETGHHHYIFTVEQSEVK
jgi:hypothetical protein